MKLNFKIEEILLEIELRKMICCETEKLKGALCRKIMCMIKSDLCVIVCDSVHVSERNIEYLEINSKFV